MKSESQATIERQAREWLIRMDGDEPLTDSETTALKEWMLRSPSHRDELVRLCRFWLQANVLTQLAAPPEREASQRDGRKAPKRSLTASLVAVSTHLMRLFTQLLTRSSTTAPSEPQ